MLVTVSDTINVTGDEKVIVNLGAETYKVRAPKEYVDVSINDSYKVTPYAKATLVDYTMPASMLDGFVTDIDVLREDLLHETANRELAIVETQQYSTDYTDGINAQTLATIDAQYLSNDEANAYILKTELSTLNIEYDSGAGVTNTNFQEMNDTIIAVDNAQASYTEDLQVHVSNTEAIADRTTTLEAEVNDVSVSIVGDDSIQIDENGEYTASTQKIITGPNGEIIGWSALSAQDPLNPYPKSEFVISADVFKVKGTGATSNAVFTVDSVGEVTFNGRVTFSSSNTNINTTNNLIPTYTWDSASHDDYTFVGDIPVGYTTGISGFSELEITLDDSTEEVYSPYVPAPTSNDLKASYAFKGGEVGTIIMATDTIATLHDILPTGLTLEVDKWYIVQVLVVRSSGTATDTYGAIKDATTLETIATVPDIIMEADKTRVILGFIGTDGSTIEVTRPNMEGMSADVSSIDVVHSDTMYTAIANDTTVIDGGRITTNTINADRLTGDTVWTNGTLRSSDYNTSNPYTSGFLLDSNPSSGNPNIYGAYIKGGTIEGASIVGATIDATTDITAPIVYGNTFRILAQGYPNNSGAAIYVGLNSIFYGNGYSSGFIAARVCSSASSVTVQVSYSGYGGVDNSGSDESYPGYLTFNLQKSISGGAWTTVATSGGIHEFSGVLIYKQGFINNASTYRFRVYVAQGGSESDSWYKVGDIVGTLTN